MQLLGRNVKAIMHEDNDIAEVAKKIIRYLRIRPEAADTVEGVARWWLRQQRFDESFDLVEKALERLRREGVVIRTVTRSGNTIYRRSRPKAPAGKGRNMDTFH